MWVRAALLGMLALLAVFLSSSLINSWKQASRDASASADRAAGNPRSGRVSAASKQPTPVALNRGAEVPDGFRGDVHPLLFGRTRMEVTAEWTPVGTGRDQMHRDLNPILYSWFTELR